MVYPATGHRTGKVEASSSSTAGYALLVHFDGLPVPSLHGVDADDFAALAD